MIAVVLLLFSSLLAYSAFAGGCIATCANTYFFSRAYARKRSIDPHRLVKEVYWVELNKLVITGFLFAGVFLWVKPLNVGALMTTFALVYLSPMLYALLHAGTGESKDNNNTQE